RVRHRRPSQDPRRSPARRLRLSRHRSLGPRSQSVLRAEGRRAAVMPRLTVVTAVLPAYWVANNRHMAKNPAPTIAKVATARIMNAGLRLWTKAPRTAGRSRNRAGRRTQAAAWVGLTSRTWRG